MGQGGVWVWAGGPEVGGRGQGEGRDAEKGQARARSEREGRREEGKDGGDKGGAGSEETRPKTIIISMFLSILAP